MRDLPRAMSTDQRFYGVLVGTVEVNDGDDEGRVKVSYPWFDGNATKSEWARVVQLYAGGGYGTVFVPELGDEVLIAFYQGDMRAPYVLGGLYNGVDKPPTAHDKGRDQKIIRTKAGHEILFDDKSKDIRITTAQGGNVTVSADGKITLKAAEVTIDAGKINLGDGASHQVPFGEVLLNAYNTHTHPAPGGTTSPTVQQLQSQVALSQKTKTS
jgi:uncharacterized protein involved in type VI secretion and phage assembly